MKTWKIATLLTMAVVMIATGLLVADRMEAKKVVFIGDSITEFWGEPSNSLMFPLNPQYVDKGIHGQTTTQILGRFKTDVVARHPDTVVILAGINDLSVYSGQKAFQIVTGNLTRMVQLAQNNGEHVVLASLLPIDHSTRVGRMYHTPQEVKVINAWSKAFCASHGCTYLDYYDSMADAAGTVKPGLTKDGVHPTSAGYRIMARLLTSALEKAD